MTGDFSDDGFADEGESQGSDLSTHNPTGAAPTPDVNDPPGLIARIVKATRVLLGRDVRFTVIADPQKVLANKRSRQTNRIRGAYATVLIAAMCAQVAFADYVFLQYVRTVDYQVESSVFIAFLSSVVVEVIGLVLVVTRAIFDDQRAASELTDAL